VKCSTYLIHDAASCYACVDDQPEARRTYVYAYTADCKRGIEFVTCNYDPIDAAKRLGPVSLSKPRTTR
jgi:hypothetical protein